MGKIFFNILITLVLVAPGQVLASRVIPDDNLAYPVLVSLNTGSKGSGFFLNTETGTFLITAAHVLFDKSTEKLKATAAKLISYSKDPNESKKNVIHLNLTTLFTDKRIQKH